jgi:hypothetical protein
MDLKGRLLLRVPLAGCCLALIVGAIMRGAAARNAWDWFMVVALLGVAVTTARDITRGSM